MRVLPLLLLVSLSSCVRNQKSPTREEEDPSIRFPALHDRSTIHVGEEGNVYTVDGVTLRAINIAAEDFLGPESKARECWEKREAHRFRVIRQGDIIFVDVSLDPFYCQMPFMFLDYGVRYAISTDGRILRRLFDGEPEDGSSPASPDAGELGPEYEVDPSKVGGTFGPVDHEFLERIERMYGSKTASRQDGGSSQPSSPDAGTPVAPSQADGGTPSSP